jgi:hypothetical protein
VKRKRQQDVDTPELRADAEDMLAFLDAYAAQQIAEVEARAKVFDQVFIGEYGSLRYDFEIVGTGMSLREWEEHLARER